VPSESQQTDSPRIESSKPEPRSTIALIGATPIAEQIAAKALRAGLNVIIDDVSDHRLQAISINLRAVVRAQDSCAPGPQNQSASPQSDLSSLLTSPSPLPDLLLTQSIESAIRAADFLIDALPDDLEVKLELFTLFDKFAKPNAIFITTGSIPIDDLAEITFCPDRCVAIRFTVAPSNANSSFQLIPGQQTSSQTFTTCTALFREFFPFLK
jgi:3-hydroxybutyryl-CoA dehydrogenase